MKKANNLMVSIFVLTLFVNSLYAQTTAWVYEKTENGITVYSKRNNKTGVKEVKIQAQIKTNLKHLLMVLHDLENASNWMPYYENSATLERVNKHDRYDYVEVSLPWPLHNRDLIVRHTYTIDSTGKIYNANFVGMPDYIPQKEGIVRLRESSGTWQITEISENLLNAEYEMAAHPGIGLPAWVINLFIMEVPIKTITQLKNFVEKE